MTIGDKTLHFQGKTIDLGELQQKIEGYLKSDGFSVQSGPAPAPGQGTLMQAQKSGFLRKFIDADHALTILISGEPGDFTVRVGIAKWLEHLGIAAAETLIVSDLFLLVDVAESAWTFEVEDKLIKQIHSFVG